MATAGHSEGLSFGMERILRLESPPAARQGEPDSTSGGPSDHRWPPATLLPLPSTALLSPLATSSRRTPPSSTALLSPLATSSRRTPPSSTALLSPLATSSRRTPPSSSSLLSPLATSSGRTPPPSPRPRPPARPLLLPLKPALYPFCAPPLLPYLQLGSRPGEPHVSCPACPDLWPMACHHLLQGADSRFAPSLVAGRRLGARRKRTWTRAVFTNLQRKGLEKRFTIQRYITKPERRKLADTLGLTDSQVKVWFQNRRMKWRNSRQAAERAAEETPVADSTQPSADDESTQPINVED